MKKNILTIIILTICVCCNAQSTKTKYYKDENLSKEVLQDKAKFSESFIQNDDGTITTEIKNLKSNEIINSQTYKENEPVGVWVYQTGFLGTAKLDYNFNVKYSDEKCDDSISNIRIDDYFQDNEGVGYKAPKISSGETTFIEFLVKNLVYPSRAKEQGIQGKVNLMFTITKTGNIENIIVTKGTNLYLDKEAVRLIRLLNFSNPPTLNGQPHSFCVTKTISFTLG